MLFGEDPWAAGVPIGTVARISGLSTTQLRRYEARGWLAPSHVDAVTGHRRYSRQDTDDARLLGALRRSGMPPEQAGVAVSDGDHTAMDEHALAVGEALQTIRELMPPEGAGYVRQLVLDTERVLTPVDPLPADDPWGGVGALQARLAARRGVAVDRLPEARRPGGLPTGPAIVLEWPGVDEKENEGDRSSIPRTVQIPWDDEPMQDGVRVSDTWRTHVLVCGLSDEVTLDKAHAVLDHAVRRRRLLEHMSRRVYCTAQLQPRALVASVTA